LPESPSVEVEKAAMVAAVSAELSAKVDPHGGAISECMFEYGKTKALGKTAPCIRLPGAVNERVAVSAEAADLEESTVYYYRLLAVNAAGETASGDMTFTTFPLPPEVNAFGGPAPEKTSVMLIGTVNPEGATISSCRFEYGPTESFGASAPCTPVLGAEDESVKVETPVGGLREETTYYARLVAANTHGTSATPVFTFTTPPTAPAVSNEHVSETGLEAATLEAVLSPNEAAVTECEFEYGPTVDYGNTVGCESLPGAEADAVAVRAHVTGLGGGPRLSMYHFRLKAANKAGKTVGEDTTFEVRTFNVTCGGTTEIVGDGGEAGSSSMFTLWDQVWDDICAGMDSFAPSVAFAPDGEPSAIAAWGVGCPGRFHVAPVNKRGCEELFRGFGPGDAFVVAPRPLSPRQNEEILERNNMGVEGSGQVLTIPVSQVAVAVVIHLPEGCTATSGKGKKEIGRLVLSDQTLEKIFAHEIATWAQVVESGNDFDGGKLLGSGCQPQTPILRVVPRVGAGTTEILEKLLGEANPRAEVFGRENWLQLAEARETTQWPHEEEGLLRASGNARLLETVAETPGSIGYAGLREVRSSGWFTPSNGGGEGTARFWPELQSDKTKFADPSTDGDVNTVAGANCIGENYKELESDGKRLPFPPHSAEDVWTATAAEEVEKKSYPLCGLSYVLGLTRYERFSSTSQEEVETLRDFLSYVVNNGQELLDSHDMSPLPTAISSFANVREIAEAGVGKLAF
jgi:ABC-type phosphate transport system substrate-binding protein